MPKIIRNAIRCKKCGDIIESKTVHDFKFCSCGSCAVDGGLEYLRRCGNLGDWEELSEVEKVEDNGALTRFYLAESGCAMRTLRSTASSPDFGWRGGCPQN